MTEIRYAEAADRDPWFRLDRHLFEEEFLRKVRDRRGYFLTEGGRPAGLLRYNLFWDNTPFCTLLMVEASCRRRGFGTLLMDRWEAEMKALGYAAVLTSTQADESAQHFYRKRGYKDCGSLIWQVPGQEQPAELFLVKLLMP